MSLVDEVEITVIAGKGGAGHRSFRREKFVPLGGPDGGDGGKGGSVIFRADQNIHTLLDFQFRPLLKADNGVRGGSNNRAGSDAEDLIVCLPVGTVVFTEGAEILCDLDRNGREVVVAKGGRGGRGNAFFRTATNRVPEHAQPGEAGEEKKLRLSLKLVADIGIIGFPNAGKSSLLARVSAARPKIADYPFTTLEPMLGVVCQGGSSAFVIADIPGLIPGAHEGRGLGVKFLKHIERTGSLLHLISVEPLLDETTPIGVLKEHWRAIRAELEAFSPTLAAKPEIIAFSKIDLVDAEAPRLREELARFDEPVWLCSSASGVGMSPLLNELQTRVSASRAAETAADSPSTIAPQE